MMVCLGIACPAEENLGELMRKCDTFARGEILLEGLIPMTLFEQLMQPGVSKVRMYLSAVPKKTRQQRHTLAGSDVLTAWLATGTFLVCCCPTTVTLPSNPR